LHLGLDCDILSLNEDEVVEVGFAHFFVVWWIIGGEVLVRNEERLSPGAYPALSREEPA
jgi:hypothetical protein